LRKWNIIVVNWCCLCKKSEETYLSKNEMKSEETVDYLLLHCKTTTALWNFIFGLFSLA
jgi:hypothetical protein